MFITFEGGEGAGKTTLIQKLATHLTEIGKEIVLTREPGGCPLAEEIRSLLLKKKEGIHIGGRAELLLFLSARAEHVQSLILPSLKSSKWVLCDRFQDSTLAYQVGGRGLPLEEVLPLALFAADNLKPDLTFYLDIPPEEGLKRASRTFKKEAGAGEKDRIESLDLSFHRKVREYFLKIGEDEKERVVILNGLDSKELVFEKALSALLRYL